MFLGALSVIGCTKETPVAKEATLSSESLVFDCTASNKSVSVTFSVDGLSVSSAAAGDTWCTAEVVDNTISVAVEENNTAETRRTIVTVSFNDSVLSEKTVEVAQEAGTAKSLTTTAVENYKYNCRGGEYSFTVKSSDEWTAELVDCDWAVLTSSKTVGTVTVTASANDGDAERTGKVKVSDGTTSLQYSFSQECEAQDEYLSLLGEYDIYASKWYSITSVYSARGYCTSLAYDGTLRNLQNTSFANYEGTPFTRTATLVEDKYGKSYLLNDFLIKGVSVPVNYDAATGSVTIPAMWNCGFIYDSTNKVTSPCFLVGYWVQSNYIYFNRNSSGLFKCEVSEDKNTITITTGLNTEVDETSGIQPGSGLTMVYMDMSLGSPALTPFKYSCLPFGDNVQLKRILPENPGTEEPGAGDAGSTEAE